MLMQTGSNATAINLKSYTKDIPPGWRPRAYPLKEYQQALTIWVRLTQLPEEKWGAAIMSRLDGQALKIAHDLQITRYNTELEQLVTLTGVEALSLPSRAAGTSTAGVNYGPDDLGLKVLINKLKEHYELDDQDLQWTSIDPLLHVQTDPTNRFPELRARVAASVRRS